MRSTHAFGVDFKHPVLLAAGTCGFGEPVVDTMDLSEIGGLVTKSVTLEPRVGNPAPRVTEYPHGMLNSVGLANPGLEGAKREKLPWMRKNLVGLPILVSVAGHRPEEYREVVAGLDEESGFVGFELNLSCPNDTRLGGRPFSLDHDALRGVMAMVRPVTSRPLLVKLAPNDPDIATTAEVAADSGADGITAINTVPGYLSDPATGEAELGAGPGGTSGPGIFPVGLAAVRAIVRRVQVPVIGVGGVLRAADAVRYLEEGAALVQIGTGSFADPRCAARVAQGIPDRLRHRASVPLASSPRHPEPAESRT